MKTTIRRIVAGLAITGAMLTLAPVTASAIDEGTDPIASATGGSLTVTSPVVSIVTGLVMPFVLSLFARFMSTAFRKGLLGIIGAALAALVERALLADGSAVFTQALVLDWLYIYVPQVLTYLGLWEKFGGVGLNAKLLPRFGRTT